MKNPPIEIEEVKSLYAELVELNKYVNPPKPDPAVWPPEGWAVHPQNPELVYQVKSAEVLHAELFGSPEKKAWLTEAKRRVAAIEKILIKYFYPEPKEEGTQRKTKDGFVCMLKTGLKRVVDSEAVEQILEKCKGKANDAIEWEAKLALKEYRALDEEVKEVFDHCITEKEDKPVFEIVAKED